MLGIRCEACVKVDVGIRFVICRCVKGNVGIRCEACVEVDVDNLLLRQMSPVLDTYAFGYEGLVKRMYAYNVPDRR
jgi:hypothetical protein